LSDITGSLYSALKEGTGQGGDIRKSKAENFT